MSASAAAVAPQLGSSRRARAVAVWFSLDQHGPEDPRGLGGERHHVWTAPSPQGFFAVSANGSATGHVYRLEMRPATARPHGHRGSTSNHYGAPLRPTT